MPNGVRVGVCVYCTPKLGVTGPVRQSMQGSMRAAFRTLLCQESAPASRNRYVLLQREVEQRLAGYLYLVSLRYYLRTCADPAPTPAPIAAPLPPPARAPMIDPTAAPPTVLFAVLAPRDLPVSSYSPVT